MASNTTVLATGPVRPDSPGSTELATVEPKVFLTPSTESMTQPL